MQMVIRKIFFVRCAPKVGLVGIVFRVESLFSCTSAEKLYVCEKLKQAFRTQVDTNLANYRYTANKKKSFISRAGRI